MLVSRTSVSAVIGATIVAGGPTLVARAAAGNVTKGWTGVLPLNGVMSIIGAPVVVLVLLRSRRGAFAG
jgi:ABC-type Fe3+-siderophore transport system permease subunit